MALYNKNIWLDTPPVIFQRQTPIHGEMIKKMTCAYFSDGLVHQLTNYRYSWWQKHPTNQL